MKIGFSVMHYLFLPPFFAFFLPLAFTIGSG